MILESVGDVYECWIRKLIKASSGIWVPNFFFKYKSFNFFLKTKGTKSGFIKPCWEKKKKKKISIFFYKTMSRKEEKKSGFIKAIIKLPQKSDLTKSAKLPMTECNNK